MTRFDRPCRPAAGRCVPVPRTSARCAIEPLEGRTLLSAGDFAFDPSFGQGGRVVLDVSGGLDEPQAAAETPDGKFVVAGFSDLGGFVARFNADGSRDSAFGDNGVVVTDRLEGVTRLAVQGDGKILLADDTMEPAEDDYPAWGHDIGILRLNADGTTDTSFGKRGLARLNFGGAYDFVENVYELMVTPEGKVVVVGSTPTDHYFTYPEGTPMAGEQDPIPREDVAVGRLNSDGTLDDTFGAGGMQTIPLPEYSVVGTPFQGMQAALTADGDVVVASAMSPRMHFNDPAWPGRTLIARLGPDGRPDPSFGDGGTVTYTYLESGPINDLAITPDGSIYLIGSGPGFDARVTRLTPNGSFDTTFGDGGRLILGPDPTEPGGLQLQKLWPQSDGTLLTTAGALFPCVVRFTPDGGVLGKASGQGQGLTDPIQPGFTIPLPGGKLFILNNTVTATGPTPNGPGTDVTQRDLLLIRLTVSPQAVTWPGGATGGDVNGGDEGNGGDSVGGDDVGGDDETPSAVFVGKRVVKRGRSYTFRVRYQGVEVESLGDDDILVTGPGGAATPAKLVHVKRSRGGPPVVATYRVAAPAGRFGRSAAGRYTLRVADGGVTTVSASPGRAAALDSAATLGAFEVRHGRRRAHSETSF